MVGTTLTIAPIREADESHYDVIGEYEAARRHNMYVNGRLSTGEEQMKTVVVKRTELLEKLKANRNAHQAVFELALEGYRKSIVEHLEMLLEDAKAGKRISHHIQREIPMNQTSEYDQAIMMLEMSVEDEIEITSNDFACYVMDRWAWKRQFSASNAIYASIAHSEGELPADYQAALSVD